MPHMMPMFWMFMMLFTMIITFLIISLIYFMYTPIHNNNFLNYNTLNKFKWIWKW